jgi:tetratricopeptide (TPR) repeat protein
MRRLSVWLLIAGFALAAWTVPAAAQGRIKLPAGLKDLEAAARTDSNDAAAHYNVALAYWNEKRYDDAERELRAATRLDGRLAPAYLALAYLPYARRPKLWNEIYDDKVPGEWKKPLEDASHLERQAYLIDPLVDMRIIGAVRPYSSWIFVQGDWFVEFLNLLNQGLKDYEDGKYRDAEGRFQRLIEMFNADHKQDRDFNFLFWYHGLAAAQLGNWDVAIPDLERLLESAEKGEHSDSLVFIPLKANEYRYVLANVNQRAGHIAEAVRLYREAVEHDIGLYMAHVQLANIYEANRDYTHAIDERRAAWNANPDDPSLLTDLGVTLGKAGQWKDAIDALRQARDANSRDYRPPFWLGIAELQVNDTQDAKQDLTTFINLAPSRMAPMIAHARQQLAGIH